MGKHTTATIKDINTNNPRLCLSPKRYLGKCYECWVYQMWVKGKGKKCDSMIVSKEMIEYEKKVKKQAELRQKINDIEKEIEEIEGL